MYVVQELLLLYVEYEGGNKRINAYRLFDFNIVSNMVVIFLVTFIFAVLKCKAKRNQLRYLNILLAICLFLGQWLCVYKHVHGTLTLYHTHFHDQYESSINIYKYQSN